MRRECRAAGSAAKPLDDSGHRSTPIAAASSARTFRRATLRKLVNGRSAVRSRSPALGRVALTCATARPAASESCAECRASCSLMTGTPAADPSFPESMGHIVGSRWEPVGLAEGQIMAARCGGEQVDGAGLASHGASTFSRA